MIGSASLGALVVGSGSGTAVGAGPGGEVRWGASGFRGGRAALPGRFRIFTCTQCSAPESGILYIGPGHASADDQLYDGWHMGYMAGSQVKHFHHGGSTRAAQHEGEDASARCFCFLDLQFWSPACTTLQLMICPGWLCKTSMFFRCRSLSTGCGDRHVLKCLALQPSQATGAMTAVCLTLQVHCIIFHLTDRHVLVMKMPAALLVQIRPHL